jgi:hypothetical protein
MEDLDWEHNDEDQELLDLLELLVDMRELQGIMQTQLSHKRKRIPCIERLRWDEQYFMAKAIEEKSFIAQFRVNKDIFNILVSRIGSVIGKDDTKALNAMGQSGNLPITPVSRIALSLAVLGGARLVDRYTSQGIARSTAKNIFKDFVRAVNAEPSFRVRCDMDDYALRQQAGNFQARSSHGLFKYCVGAIDGLLIRIRCPSVKSHPNNAKFHCAHKMAYGINLQVVCDAHCKIIGFSCQHTGSTNDIVAFESSNLKHLNEKLSFPYHWNGDGAYRGTEFMMTPFEGTKLSITDPDLDSFNFYHSQIRITVERCFGMLIQRFGIFWSEMKYEVKFIVEIVHCCIRLHNMCVDFNLAHYFGEAIEAANKDHIEEHFAPAQEEWPRARSGETIAGNSLRQRIVTEIVRNSWFHRRNM